MTTDPSAARAEIPCPKCGSKNATWTPAGYHEYQCRECNQPFDAVRIG